MSPLLETLAVLKFRWVATREDIARHWMQVHPFVGFYDKKPEFIPENREVEYLISAGLGELSDPKRVEREKCFLRHGG